MQITPAAQDCKGQSALSTELLILSDGRVLVHNLTPVFAALLNELNHDDQQIRPRRIEMKYQAAATDDGPVTKA